MSQNYLKIEHPEIGLHVTATKSCVQGVICKKRHLVKCHSRPYTISTQQLDFLGNCQCNLKLWVVVTVSRSSLQLDCRSAIRTRKINLPANQKGYNNFETTIGKLLVGIIQNCRAHFSLIIF